MKEFSVVWSDKAYQSLRDIHDFIAEDSPKAALNVGRELVKLSNTLRTLPRRNPIEPALADNAVEYRFLLKWSYKIIYAIREEERMVLILLVFDTRQNPKRMKGDL